MKCFRFNLIKMGHLVASIRTNNHISRYIKSTEKEWLC